MKSIWIDNLNLCKQTHRSFDSFTLASDFEIKSTKPKPRCASSPGVIFFGIRMDFSSPNALNRSRTSLTVAWNGILRTKIFDPVCFNAFAVLRLVLTSVLDNERIHDEFNGNIQMDCWYTYCSVRSLRFSSTVFSSIMVVCMVFNAFSADDFCLSCMKP